MAQYTLASCSRSRAPQEPLNTLGQPDQRLAVQIVRHPPVITGDRHRLAVVAGRYHGSKVQASRPALGPLGHSGSQLTSEAHVRL